MPPKRRAAATEAVTAGNADSANEDLDAERRKLMARNMQMLAAIGVAHAVHDVRRAAAEEARMASNAQATTSRPPVVRKPREPRRPKPLAPLRRSKRIAGAPAPVVRELDDDGNLPTTGGEDGEEEGHVTGLLDLLGNGGVRVREGVATEQLDEEQRAELEARRCSAKARGVVYDKALGLTCHFCRQKKLCGEDGCPRCSARNASADCIGKTSCSQCQSATGIFCGACLEVRYGQNLQEVRADPTWLCPHCYVDKHGDWREHGWFCNSSICMRHLGNVPTGIAIHVARQKGFHSVAHMLQAEVLERKRSGFWAGKKAAPGAEQAEGCEGAAAAGQQQAAEAQEGAAVAAAVEVGSPGGDT